MTAKTSLPFHCLGMERTTRFLCDAQMLNVMADGLPGVIAYYDVNFVCHFVNETVEAFEALVNGDLDELPEQAFLNVGGIDGVGIGFGHVGSSVRRGRSRPVDGTAPVVPWV